ncbi:MAG: high-affinity nickel-transport family protein [Gemmatimonadaceae bacterium]
MLSSISVLTLGFILGMRHATDPDHVVAVTTIVSQQRSVPRAARIGALWGAGHTMTIVLVGGAILLFRLAIPPRLGLAMELAVAVMLVLLGVRSLQAVGGRDRAAVWSPVRPLLVGFLHGLAGSAFVAMLVLTAIESALVGVAYLLVFGAGTVAGMTLVTAAIAVPSAYAAARVSGAQRYLQLAAGVASVCLGLVLAHRVGVTDGLFAATPHWTPQ